MTQYQSFVGVDIGKFNFVINIYGMKETQEYQNTEGGIRKFLQENKKVLSQGLVILEATGGYEMEVLMALCSQDHIVHRANTRKVKNFIRSYGNEAKTDELDAKALAFYGKERSEHLSVYRMENKRFVELYELTQRRKDLKQMLVAEKNRLQGPRVKSTKGSIESMLAVIEEELKKIGIRIRELIEGDDYLQKRKEVLKTIPGVGEATAEYLTVMMPELGSLNRREAASLAGVAPRARDSGQMKGYRRTANGRNTMKPVLFLAAMAARRSNTDLKIFYESLIQRGKKKMVALTALMRKIVVIANARLKEIPQDFTYET